MRLRLAHLLGMVTLAIAPVKAQVMLTESAPSVTINFSDTTPVSVGSNPSTPYAGAGFAPDPTFAGRLNSNAWRVSGFDYGTLPFGGTQTVDDFGRGSVASPVLTPGFYAYTDNPASVTNPTLLIQSGTADFAPGSLVLRIKNNGTQTLTQLDVSYNIYVRNDENRASSFTFAYSADDVTYTSVPALDYVTTELPDAFAWNQVGVTPSRNTVISGLNVAPGAYYYIRWSVNDVSGTGDRDEIGLDDIVINGIYGTAPEINVVSVSGVQVLSGDTTPSVAESTDFAPVGSPISTVAASLSTTFRIENLGGAVLNVTSVIITGANNADFTVYTGTNVPTGAIAAVSGSTISNRGLTIIFDPSFEGLHTARVNIYSNDNTGNENPYWFDIQGYGFVPKPDINVKGVTGGVGNIQSGNMVPVTTNNTLWPVAGQVVGTSSTKDYRIQNTATAPVQLQLTGTPKVQISGVNPSDFVVTTQPTATSINSGFGSNFVITFTPSAAGIRSAIVTIANNDTVNDPFTGNTENPYTFLVQGKGVSPEAELTGNSQPVVSGSTTPSLANYTFFDYLNVTGATLDRTFSIKNTGDSPLTLGAITISGMAASDFSVITAPAASVAVGATTNLVIRFDPTATGQRDAVISMVTNDYDENPYTFAVRGFGIDYTPCSYLAVETIGIQDFETTPATPTWAYTTVGTTLTGGTAFGASGDSGASNKFIGARSLQLVNSSGTSVTGTATFGNINTSLYNDIELTVRLASLSSTATEGADTTDKALISVSADGGATWSDEVEVRGNNNTKWSFTSGVGIANGVYDGNNVVTAISTASAAYATTDGYSTVRISNLPKTNNLQVRVQMLNNGNGEIWALDNVSLFGRKEVTTTWSGSAWSNGAPTSSVKAIINGNYSTASGNLQACKLVVNAGFTVTINSNQNIVVQSDLDNSGTIVIENGGSLVQKNDYATNTGTITVKRNTTGVRRLDYTYWSSPVSGQTLFNLSPLTLADKFYQFNTATNAWQSVPAASTVMAPGKGYIVRAPQTFDLVVPAIYNAQFVGPANNGFVTQPILNSTGTWNLLGNPYPSAIDADLFLNLPGNNILGGTIYFWTHNSNPVNNAYLNADYASYNKMGGVGTAATSTGVNTSIPTGKIASGQGFFAVATAAGTATFNNSMRLTASNLQFFRQAEYANAEELPELEKHRLWLDFQNAEGDKFRQILLGYADAATDGEDRDYDGRIFTVNTDISFYSILADGHMVIQGDAMPFDVSDKFLLGYQSALAGTYSISIENMDGLFLNQDIYLRDNLSGLTHDLKQSAYSFTTEAGTFNDRFEIVYQTEALSVTDLTAGHLVVSVLSGVISVRSDLKEMASVSVYDLTGRRLYQSQGTLTSEHIIPQLSNSDQALLVQVRYTDGTRETKKVLVTAP